jgi:Flp pilus assembly protein TadG
VLFWGLDMLGTLRSFLRSSRGNVAMIFAISLVPLIYLTGMGVDYGSAAMRESQLNAIADSASLAAVTPAMMDQTDSASVTAATNYFNAQATAITGVNSPKPTVTVADSITTRTVTVSFTATSTDFFPNVLGRATIPLSGSSQAVGSVAPNIDFYLLLDDSPSMALPATTAGIASLQSYTTKQETGGCAFACHESDPSADNLQNPSKVKCADGSTQFPTGGEDNYSLAVCLGITLRVDNMRTAVENLTSTATQTEQNYSATYRMAVYTFDSGFNSLSALTSSLSTVSSEVSSLALEEVYKNNNLTSSNANADEDTNYDNAMTKINTAMPAPGNGTNAKGDTPQEVLFIVTDGIEDEPAPGTTLNPTSDDSGRQQYYMNANTDWCTKIKNRGIRIAIIYTQYLPVTNDGWYNNFDNSGKGLGWLQTPTDQVATALQSCASPGLYYEVTTNGDISSAMSSLFQEAVVTAHLSK